jgi:hypothetical protein
MPLSSVRLTRSGFLPSEEVTDGLRREATEAARQAEVEGKPAADTAAGSWRGHHFRKLRGPAIPRPPLKEQP